MLVSQSYLPKAFTAPMPEIMAFAGDPVQGQSVPAQADTEKHLRVRFGFTRAEARVALAVLNGGRRRAVAAELGVSDATVRTHLGRVFDKTGVRRQAELVQVLMRNFIGK
jgi:DNA-binding CsgD family transcriptional regulator